MSERDPELDALWRRHSAETPPAALDDAIRAAAHRAVHAKPSATLPRARAPWPAWATFAAAASIGAIAIGVWQLQPRDVDETQVVASDTPARAGAPRPVVAPPEAKTAPTASGSLTLTPAPAGPVKSARTPDGSAKSTQTPNRSDSGKPAPAPDGFGQKEETTLTPKTTLPPSLAKPSPFPAAGSAAPAESMPSVVNAPSAPRMGVAPMPMKRNADAERVEADAAPPDSGASRAQVGGAAAPAQRGAMRSVDDFVDTIRRALAEHRDADAITALATMRAQYVDADARLPADLRAWAARVPRAPVN